MAFWSSTFAALKQAAKAVIPRVKGQPQAEEPAQYQPVEEAIEHTRRVRGVPRSITGYLVPEEVQAKIKAVAKTGRRSVHRTFYSAQAVAELVQMCVRNNMHPELIASTLRRLPSASRSSRRSGTGL